MNIEALLQARVNRDSRMGNPFKNYIEFHKECDKCIHYLKNTDDSSVRKFLVRSIIITAVTSIEVYYKDMLDAIFRICNPDYWKSILKDLHKTKYDIDELIIMYEKKIHPCELIALNQSFQNIETIEAVFKKFLGSSLFEKVFNLELRVKDDPSTETKLDKELLTGLDELFKLRHELVHSPNKDIEISIDKLENLLANSFVFLFGTNIILTDFFEKHI